MLTNTRNIMDEPIYYLEIYPINVKNNKLRNVHPIGDFFALDKYRQLKLNKNTFRHTDIGISLDSIRDYNDLKYELSRIHSFYHGYDMELEIDDREFNRYMNMKNKLEKISNDWTRKANAFIAWRRRRQVIAVWEREYEAS